MALTRDTMTDEKRKSVAITRSSPWSTSMAPMAISLARSVSISVLLQQLELLDRHEHRPCLRAFARAHDAALLKKVHHPAGAGLHRCVDPGRQHVGA